MKTLKIVQGSPEWAEIRSKYRPASEAPAMMGFSPHTSRSDLIKFRATGIKKEVSRYTEEVVFARGHAVEPAARAIAEELIGEELFPAVAIDDDGYLLASFDGVTMLEDEGAEIKQWNEDKARHINQTQTVPPADYWQVVHQLAVNAEAKRWLYLVTDGAERKAYCWVERNEESIAKLRAGWRQLDADVAAYVLEPAPVAVVATPVTALPAVLVQVDGQLTVRDNFDVFRAAIEDFLEHRLIREPKTDQDFADLDLQIKAMKNAEETLDAAEAQMLAQVSAIDTATKTKAMLSKLVRDNRLTAEKLLASEKDRRRAEILMAAKEALAAHIANIDKTLGGKIRMPVIAADFAGVMKGKRTITTLEEAANTELARAKIEANQVADRIRLNLDVLRTEAIGYETLFMDAQALVTSKSEEDLRNLVKTRIGEHQAKEQAKLEAERERIRREEEQRAQLQKEQELEAERQRIREEEAEKLRAEQKVESQRVSNTVESEAVPEVVAAAPRADQACTTAASDTATASVSRLPTQAGPSGSRIKLGDINARIAPLSISAEGLASLGFQPVAVEKTAKLYAESDFVAICNVLSARLQRAAAMQEAA